jgi:dihydropteroate synthase
MQVVYQINGKELSFDKTHVMGIVNLTPDSFFDGGKYQSDSEVMLAIEKMIEQGASIIDVGAASSKPDSVLLTLENEIKRLGSVFPQIVKNFPQVLISLDTYQSEVAKFGLDQGADIINDISAGDIDNQMIDLVAKYKAIYVMMHMQGTPQTMQKNPHYVNVLDEVKLYFETKIKECQEKQLTQLIIDPGFGFGKTVEHNYQLLKGLSEFSSFNLPVLAGLSRKSMINKVLGINQKEALNGTTVLNTIALLNGASILRVHDVKEAKEVSELIKTYKKA